AEESGEYSVQVISEGGCISESHINISVTDSLLVSCTNLITPNSDGINDSFIARNIEQFPGNELWIMDRTGKVVFNQKNYSNNWQGISNGGMLPKGTYYYLLDLGNNKERLKGFITLLSE
ncbi:MAG: gliding motility-associated C-terminal domain-containing protein, partial [Ignavibacteria bacterium]|nr:gliding motility-associated C-terminal domain-containing protein [Ignavibacteria bacterium]